MYIYLVPICLFIPYILFPYYKTGAEGGSEDNTVSKGVWSLSTQCIESRAGAAVQLLCTTNSTPAVNILTYFYTGK